MRRLFVVLCALLLPASAFAQLTVTTIASFDGVDGQAPSGALVKGADGALYGTTNLGGADGGGTIFRVDVATGTITAVHSLPLDVLTTPVGGGAYVPLGGLLLASDGKLYGVTNFGGTFDNGTLFRVDAGGTFELLHSFSRDVDGRQPVGTLIQRAGIIYGVTNEGFGVPPFGVGALWSFNPAADVFTVITPLGGLAANPIAGLTDGLDGFLYGTGVDGIFRTTPAGVVTPLYGFAPFPPGADGYQSWSSLTLGSDDRFYGTLYYGGAGNNGTLFRLKRPSDFTVMHAFAPTTAGYAPEGARPVGALTKGPDGFFYGTTSEGGLLGGGTLFRLGLDGTFTHLYDFPFGTPPAPVGVFGYPVTMQIASPLLLGADGNLYGTTMNGGDFGKGSVFRVKDYAVNRAPVCAFASATITGFAPPSGAFAPVTIGGVTDPDGDSVTISATSVRQDEPVGATTPDAVLSPLQVRAERDPRGDGRAYHLRFNATDDKGASCMGTVTVCIAHDKRPGGVCVDGGPLFPSIP
jgi:uncharacterized repeat protein (TIGR03803 family)